MVGSRDQQTVPESADETTPMCRRGVCRRASRQFRSQTGTVLNRREAAPGCSASVKGQSLAPQVRASGRAEPGRDADVKSQRWTRHRSSERECPMCSMDQRRPWLPANNMLTTASSSHLSRTRSINTDSATITFCPPAFLAELDKGLIHPQGQY